LLEQKKTVGADGSAIPWTTDLDVGMTGRPCRRTTTPGHSKRECQNRFGFSAWAWSYAVKRAAIVPRPHTMPLDELLQRRRRNRSHIKLRLIGAGLKRTECEECGLTRWRGKPLSLALHHINGDGLDNRLENLALLCPNCHSQTPNFGVKNVARL
jgi:5-methylcytosine-specific restriction endonuclease McrA